MWNHQHPITPRNRYSQERLGATTPRTELHLFHHRQRHLDLLPPTQVRETHLPAIDLSVIPSLTSPLHYQRQDLS